MDFGVYSASHQLMTAFMWHEIMARRGANYVISCLSLFIYNTPLEDLMLNTVFGGLIIALGKTRMVWSFQDLIRRKVYSRNDYKFLIPCHTYGPLINFCDQ